MDNFMALLEEYGLLLYLLLFLYCSLKCQSARNIDPLSACKIDPFRCRLSWPEAA